MKLLTSIHDFAVMRLKLTNERFSPFHYFRLRKSLKLT